MGEPRRTTREALEISERLLWEVHQEVREALGIAKAAQGQITAMEKQMEQVNRHLGGANTAGISGRYALIVALVSGLMGAITAIAVTLLR